VISENMMPMEPEVESNPEEEESTGSSKLLLWLVALSLGVLFVPLYLVSTTIQENIAPLEDEMATIQAQLDSTPAPDPTEEALKSQFLSLQDQVRSLGVMADELVANQINWPAVMASIASYDPAQMKVTKLAQTDVHIALTGLANDEGVVSDYAQHMRDSGYFVRVDVQSITLKTLPTATPVPQSDASATPEAQTTNSRAVEFTLMIEMKTGSDGSSN
jgi:Tfp pilus assembly protein PilN